MDPSLRVQPYKMHRGDNRLANVLDGHAQQTVEGNMVFHKKNGNVLNVYMYNPHDGDWVLPPINPGQKGPTSNEMDQTPICAPEEDVEDEDYGSSCTLPSYDLDEEENLPHLDPMTGVQCPPRKAIALTNWPKWNTRVYFQDASGHICEVFQTDKDHGEWHITPGHIGIEDAKSGTPLAVISRGNGSEIRIFYVSNRDTIQEWCHFEKRGWHRGKLNGNRILASLGSQLVAVTLGTVVKIYYQSRYGVIHECSYSETKDMWRDKRTQFVALSGSALTAITYPGQDGIVVHVYYQAEDLTIREFISEGSSCVDGTLCSPISKPHTLLAATFLDSDFKETTLYFQSPSGSVQELRSKDDEWDDEISNTNIPFSFVKGEQMALMHQELVLGVVLRGYFIMDNDEVGEVSYNIMATGWSKVTRRPV